MIVTIENVNKSFTFDNRPPLLVLNDFSCTIREGEFLCVLGPSGCGKSTLLTMLGGLESPSAGQDHALIPWRNVIDNVAFGLEVLGVDRNVRKEKARSHLRLMGIEGFEHQYPHQLSGGMRQRVGIARALTNDPEILLMDEPFGSLDAQTRTVMQEELTNLWMQDQKTVLFITHSIEEALLLGDRVLVIGPRPGRVIEDLTIPFARPRSVAVERDPRFAEMRLHIWDLLKQGIERPMQPSAQGIGP